MTNDVKKTAEEYGTVSEKEVLEKAKDGKKVTEEMFEKENKSKKLKEKEEKEEKLKELKEADKKSKASASNPRDDLPKEKEEKDTRPDWKKTREERDKEALISSIENWVPKTSLGRKVKEGKIKNIDEILDNNLKILEPEIVDSLLSLKNDLILQGQSKGKFGGGKRRAWRQTQRITREGGVMTFSSMAVVGDENGHVGIGVGRAGETLPARDKSTRKAKLNIIKVKRGNGSFDSIGEDNNSIPFTVSGKSGSVRVTLMPAPQGTGLVCANEIKKILSMAGIKDIYSKTEGRVRTTFNTAKATIAALEQTMRGETK